jgi:hypothetical protein
MNMIEFWGSKYFERPVTAYKQNIYTIVAYRKTQMHVRNDLRG